MHVRTAWGLAALLLVMPWLPACLGGAPPPMIRKWTLEYPPPHLQGAKPLPVVIRVERFSAAVALRGQDMIYRPASHQRQSYPYQQWWAAPSDLVGDLLLRDLQASRLFAGVLAYDQRGRPRYRLEGGVQEFLEVDRPQGWRARLWVNLALVDTADPHMPGRVLLQKDYRLEEPIADKGAAGLAAAMSRAAQRFSRQALADIYQALARAVKDGAAATAKD